MQKINILLIHWKDPKSKVSKYFTVEECLWLPQWKVLGEPNNLVKVNIHFIAAKMDYIREILGEPIIITSWFRPLDYNILVKGATSSLHILGCAVDFVCKSMKPTEVQKRLVPFLDLLDIRMENCGKGRTHIDLGREINRYFLP